MGAGPLQHSSGPLLSSSVVRSAFLAAGMEFRFPHHLSNLLTPSPPQINSSGNKIGLREVESAKKIELVSAHLLDYKFNLITIRPYT